MPRFEPFPALRYAPGVDLDQAAAPPYDVLSAEDVAVWRGRHPRNIVEIDVPGPDDDPERYHRAARRLRAWEDEGSLVRDDAPTFTIYRTRFRTEDGTERETVGVLGALEVVDEGAGGVLPHERTTPKAKTDRLDLTRATEANLSPVWGLSLTPGLTDLLVAPAEPVGRCLDEHGVVHTVERVVDAARIEAIAAAVAAHPVLIADGHHRYAISRTYRDERRATDGAGPWDLTLTYVGELVESQLSIDAIHRLYHGVDADDLLALLGRSFDVTPAGTVAPSFGRDAVDRGALCLVRPDGTGAWLAPRADAFDGVRRLDGALLEHALRDTEIEVTYQHGVQHVVDIVGAGGAAAGVLIRPTGIDEIRRTADEGLLMPPKSTFFTPKLRTGLVVRPLV
ncbi:MAG: DUF1015 domain-containing protein [Acidimicrobiales bacterium]|nr:DUF1015 domain-containing protein [Acidimicrobiales bacterium]MCB9395405.1 DUF1015 domain-containing protein [Acidimicrobiaceae bacterium]